MFNSLSLISKQWLTTVLLSVISHSALAYTFNLNQLPVESGDIIFREGTEPVSMAVMNYDDGGYSHAGMLYKNNSRWFVVHATPSEVTGRNDSVVIDELDFYIDQKRSKRFAVYRVDASDEQHLLAIDMAVKQLGVIFHFNEEKGTYCTLLIYRAWQAAGIDLQVQFSYITLPFVAGNYLLPKQLRDSKYLAKVYESNE